MEVGMQGVNENKLWQWDSVAGEGDNCEARLEECLHMFVLWRHLKQQCAGNRTQVFSTFVGSIRVLIETPSKQYFHLKSCLKHKAIQLALDIPL